MSDQSISVSGLSKRYRLGREVHPHDTLRDTVGRVLTKLRRVGSPHNNTEPTEFWALRDVTFSISRGEILGVLGRNGAGKSTLLKLLSRITSPTAGTITIRGSLGSLLEVGSGFHPDLSGRDNIFLNGAILGMKRAEIQSKFDEIVAFSELDHFIDTPVKRYSSGMYMRLAFGVAAHLEPDILIVDEVLAVGDALFQKKCIGKMGDVARSGRTIIFVSHNLAAIEHLCTHGLLLENGVMTFYGSTTDAMKRYMSQTVGAFRQASVVLVGLERQPGYSPYLEHLALMHPDGTPLDGTLGIGDPLRICITVNVPDTGATVDVGVGFDTPHGGRICGVSTYFDRARAHSTREGRTIFICDVPSLPLLEGEYSINCAFAIKGKNVDMLSDVARLSMVRRDFYGTGRVPTTGVFLIEQRWTSTTGRNPSDTVIVPTGNNNEPA